MKKVVSATLAGALAVGMVPAMALADDVQLLAQDSVEAFEAGTIIAVDAAGNAVDMTVLVQKPNEPVAKFTFNEKAQYVKPTAVDLNIDGVDDVKVDGTKVKATYSVKNEENWEAVTDTDGDDNFVEHIKAVGVYKVVISVDDATSPYNGASIEYTFEIVNPSLKDAFVYQINDDDEKDVSDIVFNYTGGELKTTLGLAHGDKVISADADYASAGIFTDNGSGLYATSTSTVIYKGSYAYKISAVDGGDYDGTDVLVPFTVEAADLSKENLLVAPLTAGAVSGSVDAQGKASLALISGETLVASVFDDNFELVAKTDADKINDFSTPGSYDFVLKLKADAADDVKANVIGEKEVAINVVGTTLAPANFFYNGAQFGDNPATDGVDESQITVDLSNPNAKPFDASLVYAKAGLADVPVQIVVTDAEGKPASVEDLGTPGTWKVRAIADVEKSAYAYGGASDEITVTVTAGEVDIEKAVFMSGGKIISGTAGEGNAYEMTFANADLLADITASVKTAAGKTLVAGTDYELVAYDEDGDKVAEMKDAGTYEVRIVSAKYDINVDEDDLDADAILYVEVKPVELTGAFIANAIDMDEEGEAGYGVKAEFVYTGKPIVPEVKYYVKGFDTQDTKDDVLAVLPADAYELGFTNTATNAKSAEMIDEGTYNIKVTLKNGNYVFAGDVAASDFNGYEVIDEWLYVDVPSTAWFADEVRLVSELGYMTGYYDGKNFGPYDSALREDVAVVIGRMAGVDTSASSEGSVDNWTGFVSPFDDVEPGAYYARAVQWADKAGIMTGYTAGAKAGLFGVDDEIVRQDIVLALYRYAQKYQRGFTAPEDVAGSLANYTDGAEVSGYAKTAVAWAIENGIMGVDTAYLNPKSDIIRAELAAMTVRLQPEAL